MKSLAYVGDWPITQGFGLNPEAYARFGVIGHNGADFGLPLNTPLLAPEAGIVVEDASDPTGYGNYIKLIADSGRQWLWGHRASLTNLTNKRIEAHQSVGLSGNTGNSTGPHLHLGMRPVNPNYSNGYNGWEDPLPVLQQLDDELNATPQPQPQPESPTPTMDDTERANYQAQIDALNGVNTELQKQVNALHEEVSHLRDDVIPALQAADASADADQFDAALNNLNARLAQIVAIATGQTQTQP